MKMVQKAPSKLKFVYIGKGQDQDLIGLDLKGKIAVMDRIYTKDLKNALKELRIGAHAPLWL